MSVHEIWVKSLSNINAGSKLGAMAAKIATQNFEQRYAALLLFNSTLYCSIEFFLHMFNYGVVINRGVSNPRLTKILRQYVIFGYDTTELEQILDTLREQEVKNVGKFIVICQSQVSSNCDEKVMTKLLWAYKIVNVVIIKSDGKVATAYTYFPFTDGDCNNVTPVKLESSNNSQILTKNQGSLFGMKIRNLYLCPLFVSTFIQLPYMDIINESPVGADGDLLRILAYGLNTSLELMTPHRGFGWGFRLQNGTWTGSLGDVYDNFANMSMTSAALTLSRFSDFQLSRSYYVSHIVWITHPAKLQNEALKLLHPFETSTRIAFVASYAFIVLCAFAVKLKNLIYPKNQADQYSNSVVFYSWMIFMGQAVIKLPTKSAFLQITIIWIYCCFIIRTAYQVYLISSLKGTFYEDQFESIEDAIREKYPFGGGLALRDYYIDYPAVYDNWISIDASQIVPTLLDMAQGKKFVLATNKDTAKIVMKVHKIDLHILPQKIVNSPSVIMYKKYSPFAEPVNLILSRLVSSGLPEKLHKIYTSLKTVRNAIGDEQAPLQIIHFTACYAVLVTGWILSFLVFLLEYYFGEK